MAKYSNFIIMKKYTGCILFLFLFTSCTNYIYVVRHAEKSTQPPNDPLLTEAGKRRATMLADLLKTKNINLILSTNTARTKGTAAVLSDITNVPISLYSPDTVSGFAARLKNYRSNALVVGHSNTILPLLDSLGLQHLLQEIGDNDFDNLFIIKTKRFLGTKRTLTETVYGDVSP